MPKTTQTTTAREFPCIFAACEESAKYVLVMKRPCGCYHKSHSSPRMVCIAHAIHAREFKGVRLTECKQCGETNGIEAGSLVTLQPPNPIRNAPKDLLEYLFNVRVEQLLKRFG